MKTIDELEQLRAAVNISRRKLAQKMHTSYNSLCQVLAGKRKLTANYAARIEDAIKSEHKCLKITIPAEHEAKVRAWAAQAHMQIDALCNALLSGMITGTISATPAPAYDDEQEPYA